LILLLEYIVLSLLVNRPLRFSGRSIGNAAQETVKSGKAPVRDDRFTRAGSGFTVAWLGRLRYLILGPLEVRDGKTDLAPRGGQQRKLLAILLLHAGEAVSSDLLIDELWDGNPPATAAKALQGNVSSLRKQLGPEAVDTVGAGYRLNAEPEDIDARRFENLLAEARPLERAPAAAKLREALALWRGPALADFAYDDFARHEIERLEDLRLLAVERRIDLELALGHHDDLVPELEALVHAHPLREHLRRHLMVALYRSGRQAEALDAYRDARTALRDELGLEPSEELQALQRAILDHDPELAAPPHVVLPRAAGDGRVRAGRTLRRPLLAVALGLAILGGTAAALVLTLANGKAAAIVVPPNSVARIDPSGKRIESFVGVGRRPIAVAVGAGGVWVANAAAGTVTKLDPSSGQRLDTIGVGADVNDLVVGFGSLWVADGNDGTVTEIDPRLGQPSPPIPLGGASTVAPDPVFYVAVDSRHVWATCANKLLRIDPHTSQVQVWATVGSPTGLAAGGGYVWVTTQSQALLRIDPRTPRTVDTQPLPAEAISPVYTRGSLWLIMGPDVLQIDPSSLGAGGAFPVAGGPSSLAPGDGALWVVTYGGKLIRLGPKGGETPALRVGAKLSLSGVAAGEGATWVAVSATG
jgi:DNA-binding SARP family transcriptional activator